MCVLPAFKLIVACLGPGGPEDPRDVGAATVTATVAELKPLDCLRVPAEAHGTKCHVCVGKTSSYLERK